jgi:putative membrane protein
MHRIILGSALILSPAIILAQDPIVPTQPQAMPSASASSSRGNQQDGSPSPGLTGQEMQDKKFLRDIAQGGLAEVKLGQLAATKGTSDEVKTFGAKMVADHTQMSKDLAPLADAMGIRLPKDLSKPDQAEYEKLSKLSGDDFDKEYIQVMLDDHRKDLRAFRQESMATNDDALHAEIDKSAAIVRSHMGLIIKLAKEKGIAVPPPPQRAGATPPPQ